MIHQVQVRALTQTLRSPGLPIWEVIARRTHLMRNEKPFGTHAKGERKTLGSALALQVLVPCVRQSPRTRRPTSQLSEIGRDRHSKFTFCHLVRCKGTGDDRIVKKVLQSIRENGNTMMLFKTDDGEPAIVQLQEQIIAQREHKTISQNPPAHDPQANGEAERAVQEVKAQLRAIRLGLEV